WLRDYSIKHRGQPPSKHKFMSDFGRAVVDHGGYHTVLALLRGSVQGEDVFGFDEALLPVIFGVFTPNRVLAEGTEMSTGTGGTRMSAGTATTGMSTGRRVVDGGTEMSTGTGATEMSTGTGATEHSIGLFGASHVQVTLEALAQYATQLRAAGALD